MAKEELEIEIGPDGKVVVRTIGIKGPRCLDVAEVLARIIGQEQSRQLTGEYYEAHSDIRQHVDVRHRT
jgi:hypothetical protein